MILPPGIHEKKTLAALTWFHSGGDARYYCRPRSEEELVDAVNWARHQEIPIFLLGLGANSLYPDGEGPGLAMHMKRVRQGMESHRLLDSECVEVATAFFLTNFISELHSQGLSGFEYYVGIPGTIGGSVWGNAGAQGHGISECVDSIRVLEADGKIDWLNGSEVPWAYRFSGLEERIILSVRFRVEPGGDPVLLDQKSAEFLKYKYSVQPFDEKSTGCIFRNPPEGPSAGKLIEAAGLKGACHGVAQISLKHGNFIINPQRQAKTQDVLELARLIKDQVLEKSGILLQQEVIMIGQEQG